MSRFDASRRAAIRSLFGRAAKVVADGVTERVARRLPRRRRPPGALEEPLFLAACTACGDCVEACPEGALFTLASPTALGAGTPLLVPERRPCLLCEGYPCATACPTGALVPPAGPWKIGTVALRVDQCITFRGPECGACVGRCPRGVEAIRLVRWQPRVDPDACLGCGLCIAACPTLPPAIEMIPLHLDGSLRGGGFTTPLAEEKTTCPADVGSVCASTDPSRPGGAS